jgi:hypothetical protein
MANLDDKLATTFAPIAVPADPPGFPARAQLLQNPSDGLRDAARAFAKRAIGLVPDPEYHDAMLAIMHDVVIEGERRMEAMLETRGDVKADGHRFGLEHVYETAFMEYAFDDRRAPLAAAAEREANSDAADTSIENHAAAKRSSRAPK